MGNTIMPSTALLPMTDIANVLQNQYGFSTQSDIALDTEKVAGTNSALIAIAATNEGGVLVSDRETVKNALNLGGVSADNYMSKADGTQLQNFGGNISQLVSDEIASLRDEFYQLKGDLVRQGLVNEYGLDSGFQDFFKSNDKKYIYQSFGGIEQNSTGTVTVNIIYPTQWQSFKVGDWFVIHKIVVPALQDNDSIVKVTGINNGELTFQSTTGEAGISSTGLEVGNVELFKILGEYNQGSFSFSKVVANALTNKEKYTMLNDDSNPQMQSIVATDTGFAAGFNIPSLVGGALKTFSVMARSTGSPGALTCYVMADTTDNKTNLKDLSTEAVGSGNRIIAKSAPVYSSKAAYPSPVQIDFNFQSPIDGSYPIVNASTRYVFIIVAEQADSAGDKWEIQFSKNVYDTTNTDVQANNKTYTYLAGTGLTEVSNIGDLVFIISTIEVQTNEETPYTTGLYTSDEIAIKDATQIARARLTMRINREGYFAVENSGTVLDGGTFTMGFDHDMNNGSIPSDLGIRGGDSVAIGTSIRKVTTDSSSMQLTLEKGVYLEEGAPIYKIGYKAFLYAYKKIWNAMINSYVISNQQCIEMPLTCIMPDRTRISGKYSDRLIFECEFRDPETQLPLDVNVFELQILWESDNSKDVIIANHDLVGRIYDLTLSLDKTL